MKILLIVLSKRQYEHHIEYWQQKGNEVIAATSVDEAVLHMQKHQDIAAVLIEPVLSKPMGTLLEERLTDNTPTFSAQSGGEKAFGIMFWFNLLRGKEDKITTFFLVRNLEREMMMRGPHAKEMSFIHVPAGPDKILEQIVAKA